MMQIIIIIMGQSAQFSHPQASKNPHKLLPFNGCGKYGYTFIWSHVILVCFCTFPLESKVKNQKGKCIFFFLNIYFTHYVTIF